MAKPKPIDWDAERLAFITDPHKPALRDFCVTRNLPYGTAKNHSSRDKWMTLRDQYWESVTKKAAPVIEDLQATVVARDTGQALAAIAAMKATALKFAGGTEGHPVVYEKPHEAVAAYERLVKLERLILGESTEHIKVDDARAFARDLLVIVREEVTDRDVLERIAGRIASLSVGGGPGSGTDRALH